MRRRTLLRAALLSAGLLGVPRQAFALGGTLPSLNQSAPGFELTGISPGPGGEAVEGILQLSDFAGRWLVLYFYPKDFTGGCTLEAQRFQQRLEAFHAAGAEVVGVSADDADSHASFCSSEGLAFPLLSDPGGAVSKRYGSWISPFSQRHTFLIDPQGVLRASWVAVRPSGHADEVLAELQRLQQLS
jgi:thioredoxin-dependent peroxiredoxin